MHLSGDLYLLLSSNTLLASASFALAANLAKQNGSFHIFKSVLLGRTRKLFWEASKNISGPEQLNLHNKV